MVARPNRSEAVVLCAYLLQFRWGDYNMVTVAEVEKLAGGDGSGRIQR